ncbi:MAG: hypothetical protein V1808_04220 [Candidatus Daviesbacteria bacterium]
MRKEHLINVACIGAFSFLTLAGCAKGGEVTSEPTLSPSRFSLDKTTEGIGYKITRINKDTFMITHSIYGTSTGGSGELPFGIEYLRDRGCGIEDVSPLAVSNIKVVVANGESCLPELP